MSDETVTPPPISFLPSALSLLDRLPYAATRDQVGKAVAHAMWQAHEAGYTAGRGDAIAEGNERQRDLLVFALDQAVHR